jgi:hypothetical protein
LLPNRYPPNIAHISQHCSTLTHTVEHKQKQNFPSLVVRTPLSPRKRKNEGEGRKNKKKWERKNIKRKKKKKKKKKKVQESEIFLLVTR